MEYKNRKKAILLLSDGTIFYGKSVYGNGTAFGEVCFNTGMTGYQEIYLSLRHSGGGRGRGGSGGRGGRGG